jgi:hypothetical protein
MEFEPYWLTSDMPWQPYDPDSRRREEALRQQIDADYQAPYHQLASFTRLDSTLPTAACLDRLPQALGDRNNVVCGVHSLNIRSMKTSGKSYLIKPDQLARRWRISIECARRTLEKTTQRAVRDWSVVQGSRRFRPVQYQLEYPRLKTNVYVDVKFGPCKSAEGNTCVAVYATPVQWARAYPLNKESDVHTSLTQLFRQFGFPQCLIPDDAKSLTQGKFREVANKGQVPIHPIEPHHPNQALTEDTIREGSRLYRRFMHSRNIPIAFWDRVFMYAFEIRSHMALGLAVQEGECGATIVSGNTMDISHLVDFAIWDWCWCLSPNRASKDGKQLCRWLGPSFTIGAALCFAVAIANGQVLQRSSVIPLSLEERNSEPMEEKKKEFMEDLKKNLKKKADGVSLSEDELDRIRLKHNMPISAIEDGGYPHYAPYENHTQEDPRHKIEDDFEDVLRKAAVGQRLGHGALSIRSNLSMKEVRALLSGELNEDHLRRVAPVLNLEPEKMVSMARGAWYPEAVSLDGLECCCMPFPEAGYPNATVNAYLIYDSATSEAVAFDAGTRAEPMLTFLEENGLRLEAVFLTHTHRDHVGGYGAMTDAAPA